MPGPDRPYNERKVSCAECEQELPESRAISSEAEDYVHHFCGLDCHHRWRERHESKLGRVASEKMFTR